MKQKIADFIGKFIWMGQINIRQRVFRLILITGIITFVLISVIVNCAMPVIRSNIIEHADLLDDAVADYMENYVAQQSKSQLMATAKSRAGFIELELAHVAEDVQYLSTVATAILKTPHHHRATVLPDCQKQQIMSGQVYFLAGNDCRTETEEATVQAEIALLGNIRSTLNALGDKYTNYVSSCQLGSNHGYMIVVDELGHGDNEPVHIAPKYLEHFDPRLRPWFIAGKDATKPVFTDIYIGSNGMPEITCSMPYEDAQGFAGVASISTNLQSLSQMIEPVAATNMDANFVLNNKGEVVMSSRQVGSLAVSANYGSSAEKSGDDLRKSPEKSLAGAAVRMTAGESGVTLVNVDGEDYYMAYAPMDTLDWSFGSLMNANVVKDPSETAGNAIMAQMADFDAQLDESFNKLVTIATMVTLFMLAGLVILSSELANRFVRPIYELSAGVRKIDGENLDHKIEVNTGDEIEHLAICFNAMSDELKKYMERLTKVTAEKERLATEIDVAKRIQTGVLPQEVPPRREVEIFASVKPAKSVGGDFYDYFLLPNDRLLVTIADVSGKGVSAALFMMIAKTVLTNYAESLQSMEELPGLVDCTNAHLCQSNDAMMFVTACVGILDLNTGRFVYVNAGHNPPLVYRKTEGKFSYLEPHKNIPLGVKSTMMYEKDELQLEKGDALFFYTDGVTEALNGDDEMYSEQRLADTLNEADMTQITVTELTRKVKKSLADFVGETEQSDDITTLALRYKGGAAP